MNEELILQAIEGIGQALDLYFQVIIEAPYIHVYINRDTDTKIDYAALTDDLSRRVAALNMTDLRGLYLYSRFLGLIEPDWETFVDFYPTNSSMPVEVKEEEPESAIAQPVEPVASEPLAELALPATSVLESKNFDLSSYCFIRNQRLLTAELQPPPSEIARVINIFHAFADSLKQQLIPELEKFLTTSDPANNPTSLPEVGDWFDRLSQLDESGIRKASIWFSRYCANPLETVDLLAGNVKEIEPPASAATEIESETAVEIETPAIESDRQTRKSGTNDTFPTTYHHANVGTDTPKKQPLKRHQPTKEIALWQKFAFPICVALVTVIFVLLAIFAGSRSQAVPDFCKAYPSQPNYCHLASQIVGESIIRPPAKVLTG